MGGEEKAWYTLLMFAFNYITWFVMGTIVGVAELRSEWDGRVHDAIAKTTSWNYLLHIHNWLVLTFNIRVGCISLTVIFVEPLCLDIAPLIYLVQKQ